MPSKRGFELWVVPDNDNTGFNLDRVLIGVALLGGVAGSTAGFVGDEERNQAITVRLDYIERDLKHLRLDVRRLEDAEEADIAKLNDRIRKIEKEYRRRE